MNGEHHLPSSFYYTAAAAAAEISSYVVHFNLKLKKKTLSCDFRLGAHHVNIVRLVGIEVNSIRSRLNK